MSMGNQEVSQPAFSPICNVTTRKNGRRGQLTLRANELFEASARQNPHSLLRRP
jgi:hypothetical protein